jgi:hypothetical protein
MFHKNRPFFTQRLKAQKINSPPVFQQKDSDYKRQIPPTCDPKRLFTTLAQTTVMQRTLKKVSTWDFLIATAEEKKIVQNFCPTLPNYTAPIRKH